MNIEKFLLLQTFVFLMVFIKQTNFIQAQEFQLEKPKDHFLKTLIKEVSTNNSNNELNENSNVTYNKNSFNLVLLKMILSKSNRRRRSQNDTNISEDSKFIEVSEEVGSEPETKAELLFKQNSEIKKQKSKNKSKESLVRFVHRSSGAAYNPIINSIESINVNENYNQNENDNNENKSFTFNQTQMKGNYYFDITNVTFDVLAYVGSTAYLVCRLRAAHQNNEQLQISWVKNMQILTNGQFRYTSDERFRPAHLAGSSEWILAIRNVSLDDEGFYECQVNSEPKPNRIVYELNVISASLQILQQNKINFQLNQDIQLNCRVQFGTNNNDQFDWTNSKNKLNSQHYLYWYKNNVSLEFNNPRGKITVIRKEDHSSLESVLKLEEANENDNGIYSCKILPPLNKVDTAEVEVSIGYLANGAFSATQRKSAATFILLTDLIILLSSFKFNYQQQSLFR